MATPPTAQFTPPEPNNENQWAPGNVERKKIVQQLVDRHSYYISICVACVCVCVYIMRVGAVKRPFRNPSLNATVFPMTCMIIPVNNQYIEAGVHCENLV